MDPFTIMAIASIAGSIIGGVSQNNQSNKQIAASKEAQQIAEQGSNQRAQMQTALTESLANPFRGQLAQGRAMEVLDAMANGTMTPSKVTPPAKYAGYMPQMSGGFSYTPDPRMKQSAAALRDTVMAGKQAPSMTDPANYGMSGAQDLLSILGGVTPYWSDDAYASVFGKPKAKPIAMGRTNDLALRSPQALEAYV